MTTLTAAWLYLASQAGAEVAASAAAYEAGATTASEFTERAAATVFAASSQAVVLADVAVAAWWATLVGLCVPTLGATVPVAEQERLVRAFETITQEPDAMSVPDRAARVARSEPVDRGRTAYQESLRARGVTTWRRIVAPDACEVCAPLARKVYPIGQPFRDHPGCHCTLAPEVPQNMADLRRAAQLQLRGTYDTPTGTLRFSAGTTIRRGLL